MGRLALLTPPCGGQCADREEKRVAHGNEINRQQGKTQEQLDFRDPNQRGALKDSYGGRFVRVRGHDKVLCHLMFGVLALTVAQLMRFVT